MFPPKDQRAEDAANAAKRKPLPTVAEVLADVEIPTEAFLTRNFTVRKKEVNGFVIEYLYWPHTNTIEAGDKDSGLKRQQINLNTGAGCFCAYDYKGTPSSFVLAGDELKKAQELYGVEEAVLIDGMRRDYSQELCKKLGFDNISFSGYVTSLYNIDNLGSEEACQRSLLQNMRGILKWRAIRFMELSAGTRINRFDAAKTVIDNTLFDEIEKLAIQELGKDKALFQECYWPWYKLLLECVVAMELPRNAHPVFDQSALQNKLDGVVHAVGKKLA